MKTHKLNLLCAIGAVAALSACEGEPPKVPTNPAPERGAPATQPVAAAAATAPAAQPPAPSPSVAGSSPCDCPCMGGMHGEMHGGMHGGMHGESGPESNEGAAAQTSTGQPVPVPAEAPKGETPPQAGATQHDITGTISTTPARSAGAAVVYLEDAPIVPNLGAQAVVDNRGMSFIPFVAVVAAGGRVVFTNGDPFPHNVFSPDNDRFNIGLVQPKGSVAHVFKTPGVYSLLCNLHPNMLGYLVVTPSSYFAKANAKGQYALKGVPAGTYKMTAWAPRQQPVTQSVTVKDGDITLNFTLHR